VGVILVLSGEGRPRILFVGEAEPHAVRGVDCSCGSIVFFVDVAEYFGIRGMHVIDVGELTGGEGFEVAFARFGTVRAAFGHGPEFVVCDEDARSVFFELISVSESVEHVRSCRMSKRR